MGLTQTVKPVQTKTIARHSFKEKRLKSHKYLWNMFKWTTSVSYLCMRPETVMFERWLRGGRKGTFCTLNHATFSLFIYPVGLLIQILLFFFFIIIIFEKITGKHKRNFHCTIPVLFLGIHCVFLVPLFGSISKVQKNIRKTWVKQRWQAIVSLVKKVL